LFFWRFFKGILRIFITWEFWNWFYRFIKTRLPDWRSKGRLVDWRSVIRIRSTNRRYIKTRLIDWRSKGGLVDWRSVIRKRSTNRRSTKGKIVDLKSVIRKLTRVTNRRYIKTRLLYWRSKGGLVDWRSVIRKLIHWRSVVRKLVQWRSRFYVRIVIMHIGVHVVTSKQDHKEYSKSASDPECTILFLFFFITTYRLSLSVSWLAWGVWPCLARIIAPGTCWAALVSVRPRTSWLATTHCVLRYKLVTSAIETTIRRVMNNLLSNSCCLLWCSSNKRWMLKVRICSCRSTSSTAFTSS